MNIKKFSKGVLLGGCKAIGLFALVSIVGTGTAILDDIRSHVTRSNNSFFDYANYVSGSYDNAIKAIMDSNMWSEDKRRAVSAVKRDEEKEYYLSIISIANSKMWSADRLVSIQELGA